MEAIRGLVRYPLRTFLALLGLIVGVSSVVGTIALLDASRRFAMKALGRYTSPDVVTVRSPAGYWQGGQRVFVKAPVLLGEAEAERLRRGVVNARDVTISSETDRLIRREGVSFQVPVRGVEPNAPRFAPIEVVSGRFFTEIEVTSAARAAVLSSALADDLFGDASSAGGEILIAGQRFDVVGVAHEMRQDDGEEPRLCYIPYRTSAERFGRLETGAVMIRVASRSLEHVPEIERDLKALLPSLRPGVGIESYQIITAQEELEEARSRDLIQSLTLGAVAGLSMLVAASGILNTLLVGVKQRTREIGTRRAIGASRAAILRQFLGEALALAVPGAVLGLGVGVAVAHLLGRTLAKGLFDPSMLVVVVGTREALCAAAAAIIVALGAGVWPALQAASIAPAEALRYE